MNGVGNNKIVKALLLVCVVMQVVLLMPHHHHSGSETPCIGYHHVVEGEHDACHGHHGSGHSHTHDDTPVAACGAQHSMVILQPERERVETSAAEADLPDGLCGHCNFNGFLRLNDFKTGNAIKVHSPGPDIPPVLRYYISVAIPPRAPDCAA